MQNVFRSQMSHTYLPCANEMREGNVFSSVCVCPQGVHVWPLPVADPGFSQALTPKSANSFQFSPRKLHGKTWTKRRCTSLAPLGSLCYQVFDRKLQFYHLTGDPRGANSHNDHFPVSNVMLLSFGRSCSGKPMKRRFTSNIDITSVSAGEGDLGFVNNVLLVARRVLFYHYA